MEESFRSPKYLAWLATPLVVMAVVPLALVLGVALYVFSALTGLWSLFHYTVTAALCRPHRIRATQPPHFHEVRVNTSDRVRRSSDS